MAYDMNLVAGKLRRWEKYLNDYHLPLWDDIPDIGLYMEQVIALLKGYLDYLPPELKEEQFITAATINNYVRKKIMPEPVKKRYYRMHIACLIMICSLKQSLSIPMLQTMLPAGLSEDKARAVYDAYVRQHQLAARYFVAQVRLAASAILGHNTESELTADTPDELVAFSAVISGFARLLSEKLLLLDGHTLEDGGSVELRFKNTDQEEN